MIFIIAFIIAILSGLGIGGGGLFALYLKLFSGLEQLQIQAQNLIFFLAASFFALLIHLTRRKIFLLPVFIMLVFGIFGSLVGSSLAVLLPSKLLGKIFGVMLILTGIYSIFHKNKR